MIPEQQKIWKYLTINALGMNNAIHVSDIANSLGFEPNGTNNDNVRNWIKDMVINHGKQIGTCAKGVYIITNDAEREAAAKYVERDNRADSIRKNGNYNQP